MRVMVIDDDSMHRIAMAGQLRRIGHDVTTTHDATAALAQLEGSPFDAVVVALMMPGLSGIEFARSIRCRVGAIRVVLSSSFPLSAAQLQRSGLDNVRFLAWPANTADLVGAIEPPSAATISA